MSDALSNVEVLYELPLIDSQPSVEGANNAIVYEASFDTNFEDKTAYITGISKYIEEAVLHSNLVNRSASFVLIFFFNPSEPSTGTRLSTCNDTLYMALLFTSDSHGKTFLFFIKDK